MKAFTTAGLYLEIELRGLKSLPARDDVGDGCIVHKLLLQQRSTLDLQTHALTVIHSCTHCITTCKVSAFAYEADNAHAALKMTAKQHPAKPVCERASVVVARQCHHVTN